MIKNKWLIMIILSGLIMSMVNVIPANAAKKYTVVLLKKSKTSLYNYQEKKWESDDSDSATFNKKGMITSSTNMMQGSIWNQVTYKYDKKGFLKSITPGSSYSGYTQIYKWKNRKQCTISYKQNGKTLEDKDVIRFNKDGKILSEPEYTYQYTKTGKYKQILHSYIEYDDDDKQVNCSEKTVFSYDRKDRMLSRISYDGNNISDVMRWYYRKNKLTEGKTIHYDYLDNGQVETHVNTTAFKHKKTRIIATTKDEQGNLISITVFDKKYKAYNPVPDLRNPDSIESVIPYEAVSRKNYDDGKLTDESKSKYTIYKKGERKGLAKTRVEIWKHYEENGTDEIEKHRTIYTYTTKKMTKFVHYVQSSFFGFRNYTINTIEL